MAKITLGLILSMVLSSMIFSMMVPSIVFAYSSSYTADALITVNVDRSSYSGGDTIVISGTVQSVIQGTPLVIQIFDPNNSLVQLEQIEVSQDGKYVDTMKATGALWTTNGQYTVKVQYGPPNVTAQSTFTFQSTVHTTNNVFQLQVPNNQQIFNVGYTISGGSVKTMSVNTQSLSVIVSIDSTNDGSITLQLPRSLIDSKTTSGQDDSFIILIDGAEIEPQSESSRDSFRSITIPFLQSDHDIEIIGTNIASSVPVSSPIAPTPQSPEISTTQSMSQSAVISKGIDTGSPQIVSVSSGDQSFGPITLNFAYNAPFEIIKPVSLHPGESGSITLLPNKEKMGVTVSFMGKQFKGGIELPLGEQIPMPITTGLVVYASASASATPQVTGPATVTQSSLQWKDNSIQKMDIHVSDSAKNGDQIQISVPVSMIINGGLNVDLQILKYNVIQKQIGEFQGDNPITISIPIVTESNTANPFASYLVYILIVIIAVLVAVIMILRKKLK